MEQREPGGKKSWLGVIVGVGLIIVMFGLCAAMVIPSFIVPKKSMASEVKTNLKATFLAEKSYWAEKDVYTDRIEAMGFIPERGNRYLYLVSKNCELLLPGAWDGGSHCGVFGDELRLATVDNKLLMASIPTSLMGEVGVHCEEDAGCDVTIAAAGNIDSDATVDVWSVSTKERIIGTDRVGPGMPYNHINDVEK
ncbi:MAG: hypothetical protein JNM17_11770 [Archangium sp.]|nr:hypothetical protein [Archangium sp.]